MRMTAAGRANPAVTWWYRLSYRILTLGWRLVRPTTMGVKVIVTDRNDQVLLVRPRYQKRWTLPGGGVHKQETPEDAAAREVREETGVTIDPGDLRLRGLLSSFREGKSDYVAVYVAAVDAHEDLDIGREIFDARFAPVDTLPKETSPATRRRIEEARSGAAMRGMW